MQWSNSPNGGFSSRGKPWLAVNPNYKSINATEATADRNSIYNYFAKLIALRKTSPAFVYGSYEDINPQNPNVFAYTRTLGPAKFLIVLNFSAKPVSYSLPGGLKSGKLQISNLGSGEEDAGTLKLKPWEARIYKQ